MNRLEMAEQIALRVPMLAKRDADEWQQAEALRRQFVSDFPRSKIQSLKLDDYVIGKGASNRSFCYRIEREMDILGRITGATAFKFGVYFGRIKNDASHKYRFRPRWGKNVDMAFSAVKEAIGDLLEAASSQDWEAIKKNPLSAMFKGKILFLFHPETFAPIYAKAHLEHFMAALNLSDPVTCHTDMQRALMRYRSTWPELRAQHPALYMRLLYDIFGYPDYDADTEQSSSTPSPGPLLDDAFKGAIFIEQVPFSSSDTKQDSNGSHRNTDYEAYQKACKRIGDRGEAIVLLMEEKRLISAGKSNLAKRLKHVSQNDDSIGYDILSFDEDGTERFIEVKATTGKALDRGFFISSNELEKAKSLSNYYIYFVFCTMTCKPQILRMKNAFQGNFFFLNPVAYHVTRLKNV